MELYLHLKLKNYFTLPMSVFKGMVVITLTLSL